MSWVSINYKYEYKMVLKSYKLKEYDSLKFFCFLKFIFLKIIYFYVINIVKKWINRLLFLLSII